MDFTPHTAEEVTRMLAAIGLESEADLFSHLPRGVATAAPGPALPPPMSEPELMAVIDDLAAQNSPGLVCFAGGGFYDHHLPPVVEALSARPEFVTSYTPYQSEVAQGVLQALWEYQSMVSTITGLPVSNASLYDGATAGLEATNLALAETGRESVWVSRGVHPRTREVIATFARVRDFEIHELPLLDGRTVWDAGGGAPPAAVLFSQPNHLGVVEDYSAAVETAHRAGALAVAEVDPMLLGVLRRPGDAGCDVAFGEGQPLGSPLSFGGPGLGLFAAARPLMRRLPGRLVGRTRDASGRVGYTLTLRTREQDIRREKASSNICTNQTLIAIAAAIHLAWLGPEGLAAVGRHSVAGAHHLARRLSTIPGVRLGVGAAFAREFPVLLPADPEVVVDRMAERGFLAGIPLARDLPEFPGGLLIAVTEKRTRVQLDAYAMALEEVLVDA